MRVQFVSGSATPANLPSVNELSSHREFIDGLLAVHCDSEAAAQQLGSAQGSRLNIGTHELVKGSKPTTARFKQVKEGPMRKQILSITTAFLLTLIAVAQCGAQQNAMTVNIPFAFEVGNKLLPAGEYQVRRVSSGDETVQLIRQSDGEASTIVLTMAVERTGKAPSPSLVFNRYGNDYFLREIWTGNTQGRLLHKSAREKELAKTTGGVGVEVALLARALSAKS